MWCPTGGAELDLLRSDLARGDGSWIGPLRGTYGMDWCHTSVMEGCQERGGRPDAAVSTGQNSRTKLQLVGARILWTPTPPPIFILTDGMAQPWRRSDRGRCLAPTSRGQGASPYLWLTSWVVLWLVYATDNFSLYSIGFWTIYGVLILFWFYVNGY